MEWYAKIQMYKERLGLTLSAMETSAGWSRSTLSSKIGKGEMPGSDLGTRLAEAVGVPARWLFDASTDWPPPVSDAELDRAISRATQLEAARKRVEAARKKAQNDSQLDDAGADEESHQRKPPRKHRRTG